MSDDAIHPDPRHRVAAFVASARTDLTGLAGVAVWSMTPAQTARTLLEVTRLKAQVAELELRVVAHAQSCEVGLDQGATSTATWWSHHTKVTRAEAHRLTRLATRLGEAHEPVRQALAAGEVLADQAAVIVDAVDALPTDLADPTIVAQAEAVLLAHAGDHDAKALRVLGRRVLDVVAPEVGEAHEARILAREEADARAAASLRMIDDGHGHCHGRFTIPALHGQILRKHLMALAAPRHRASQGHPTPARRTPSRHRLGQALCEYLETRPTDTIGRAGGVAATIVVTMTLDALMGGLAAASLDTGGRLTAERGPPAGLWSRDHPRRPRRSIPGPRPRPPTPVPHPTPTDRPRPAGPGVHRARVRGPTRALPRPPRPPLVHRRTHRHHHRAAPLPQAPHAGPRPDLPDQPHRPRQAQIHQADVDRPRSRYTRSFVTGYSTTERGPPTPVSIRPLLRRGLLDHRTRLLRHGYSTTEQGSFVAGGVGRSPDPEAPVAAVPATQVLAVRRPR